MEGSFFAYVLDILRAIFLETRNVRPVRCPPVIYIYSQDSLRNRTHTKQRMIPNQPKDPPALKILRRVNPAPVVKFGMEMRKRYGDRSEMLGFPRSRNRRTVRIIKNYDHSKIDPSAVVVLVQKGPLGRHKSMEPVTVMKITSKTPESSNCSPRNNFK